MDKIAVVVGNGGEFDSVLAKTLTDDGVTPILIEHRPGPNETGPGSFQENRIFADLAREEEIQSAIDGVVGTWQRIDYLINCQEMRHSGSLVDLRSDDWDDAVALNVTSVFLTCKSVVPVMIKQGSGRIVNISSTAAHIGAKNAAAFATMKAAVIGFSKSLAREVAASGVTVNIVSPGQIGDANQPFRDDAAYSGIPLGRNGCWEEVAGAVTFLLSEKSSYSTGQTIHVNGGLLMP